MLFLSNILLSCLCAGNELQFPDGVYTSTDTNLLQPNPGSIRELIWRVALSPPLISISTSFGFLNLAGKSWSAKQ